MPAQKKCFIICPLGDKGSVTRKRSDDLRNYIIEPTLKDIGIKAERADTLAEPGNITTKVIMKIEEADVIIADLTDKNPYVFYELAIAHALRKPVIHMSRKGENIPFDVNQYRYVTYDNTDLAELEPTKSELKSQLENIPRPEDVINPFTEALSLIKIDKSGSPTEKFIAEIRNALGIQEARLNRMESYMDQQFKHNVSTKETLLMERESLKRELEDLLSVLSHLARKLNKSEKDKERELYLKNVAKRLQSHIDQISYEAHSRGD